MKHTLKLILVLSCFFFACESEPVIEVETSQEQEEEQLNDALYSKAGGDELEQKLQWAAYIAAKVYLHNKDARDEVRKLMSTNNTVSLEKLIGSRSMSSPFYKEFYKEAVNYQKREGEEEDDTDPEPEEEDPPGNLPPCCTIPPDPDTAVGKFIDYLLLDNCVEYYFPNLALFDSDDKITDITSTAHPLTEKEENYGYWRFPKEHTYPDGFKGIAHKITVDDTFVKETGLVLVARPIRNEKKKKCLYETYDVKDFTEFLKID